VNPRLGEAALRWIAEDPDPQTRDELAGVLAAARAGDRGAQADLADRMHAPLRFGTAGLRGPVRAGPSGLNLAVVRRTTAGLATWLTRRGIGGGSGLVVVGRDARHGSAQFAAATAAVLAGAGLDVGLLPEPLPTPVLAFAVQHLGAVAGVQITASHNPPGDNGYKLYLGAALDPAHPGAQLVAPADAEIEAAIAAAPPATAVATAPPARVVDVTEAYLDRVARLPRRPARPLRVALTPLHGVGGATAVRALRRSGYPDVQVVESQATPDPRFPTVPVPNPEEPGATDALLALAAEVEADLAIALDPDADRCALGVATGHGWRMLSGDEVGVLLGDHLLRHGARGLVATTVVSSSLLGRVAAGYGVPYAQTLTGFKHIVRAGPGLVYGYEEALGVCVDPGAVRDKDAVSAAVLACDLASTTSLPDRLDELARAHGVHLTAGLSVRRRGPVALPDPPAGWQVERPAQDVLVLRRPGRRLVVRPSGTEPKLKAYLEVVEPPGDALPAARARARRHLDALRGTARALLGG